MKEVKLNEEARALLQQGANKLADAVKVTLGAAGRLVVYEDKYARAITTKDGVTVARQVYDDNKFINMGVEMIREAAIKTNDLVGDSTTTSTVLAQAILNEGLKSVADGVNSTELKRGIDKAVVEVVKELKNISRPIKAKGKELEQIAFISANSEKEIGKNVADAIKKVGKDGIVTIEDNSDMVTVVDTIEGMQFDRGLISPYFVNNPSRLECVLDNPVILITDKKLTSTRDVLSILEAVNKVNRSLLIICDDMDGEILSTLVTNVTKGLLKCAVVKAPNHGNQKLEALMDIAILTGGEFMTESKGLKLTDMRPAQLGEAKKVICGRDFCTILKGKGEMIKAADRVSEIRQQIKLSSNPMERLILSERAARLAGKVAVIKVGAVSTVELLEKKDRYIDAVAATKAALEEGIVPGGGLALLACVSVLDEIEVDNDAQLLGIEIVTEAIQAPFKQILDNAGVVVEEVWDNIVYGSSDVDYGYNVKTQKYENFFETGVIDPAKGVRVALQNAASVAGMMLITEAVIVNKIVGK